MAAVQSVSPAQEQVPPLRKVAQIASSLQELEDAYKAARSTAASNESDINAQLALLEADREIMNAIVQCCKFLNTHGGADWESARHQFPRSEIVPLVFGRVVEDKNASVHVPPHKMAFAQVYSDGPAPNSYPAWYKAIRSFVGYEDETNELPDTFTYLRSSPSCGDRGRTLTEQHVEAKRALETALRKGTASKEYGEAEAEKHRILKEAKDLLKTVKDIDVRSMREVLGVTSVHFQPRVNYVNRSLENFQKAEALIVDLLKKEEGTADLENALSRFYEIRENLFSMHGLLPTRDAIRQSRSGRQTFREELCQAASTLERSVEQLFPKSGVALVEALIQNEYVCSGGAIAPLLTSRYVVDGDFFTPLFIVDHEDNAVLMDVLSEKLLFSDSEEIAQLESGLQRSQVSDIVELCAEFRGHIEERNVDTLVERLDEEIEAVHKKPLGALTHTRALLSVVAAIASEPKVVQPIKGRLRNQKLLSDMVTSVTKKIGKKNSRAAAVLEMNRATINKGFSNTLKDYWGQQQLKETVKKIVHENLLLANEPQRYRGMPRHLAFINGILLSGIPGVGKTFLVECLANEYGLEMTEVSMEELRKQMSAESSSRTKDGEASKARQDIEATIDSFLESKVKIAREKMKASGATSGILMIDEMEAEFLRRNPETSPRNELEQTNIMLRVFERVMRNNPDIIFFGATNHPEHVDPAATRPGRFGIQLNVEPPTESDIKEILEGTFGTIGLSAKALAKAEKYDELVSECQGLLPLPIQNAIVHSFAVSDLDRKNPNIDDAIKIFTEAVQWMKEYIKQPEIDEEAA